MSSVQKFVCHDCAQYWWDKYSFWNGYRSACPLCGKSCIAVCDTQEYDDQREMEALYDSRPLFIVDDEDFEKSEADLEGERDLIRDEIMEALGAIEGDTSDIDDSGEDTDSDADASSEGF